jgi:phosphoglycerate dehydrogenase-like enzyme
MSVMVVEDDRVLRQVQVLMDPAIPQERYKAYVDYNSTDVDYEAWATRVRAELSNLYPAEVRLVSSTEELRAQIADADVLIVESLTVGREDLALARKLKVVQSFGNWSNNIDHAACAERGIPVKTLRRRTNIAMGEHTLLLILALAKRFALINGMVTPSRMEKAGFPHRPYDSRHTPGANFARVPHTRTLRGMTLGLLGYGEIGQEVAQLAKAFGMDIVYNKRSRLSTEQERSEGVRYASFDELMAQSDFLSVHIPMSEQTRGLVGADALARMKRGSFIVNTSRAQIIDHDALVHALRSGHLAGAALDVLYKEPDREDEPLLALANVVLTPHTGGASRLNGIEDIREMLAAINKIVA